MTRFDADAKTIDRGDQRGLDGRSGEPPPPRRRRRRRRPRVVEGRDRPDPRANRGADRPAQDRARRRDRRPCRRSFRLASSGSARGSRTYRTEMDEFFGRLLAEQDPTRIATMAEMMPEPPSLLEIAASIRGPEAGSVPAGAARRGSGCRRDCSPLGIAGPPRPVLPISPRRRPRPPSSARTSTRRRSPRSRRQGRHRPAGGRTPPRPDAGHDRHHACRRRRARQRREHRGLQARARSDRRRHRHRRHLRSGRRVRLHRDPR